MLMKLTPDVADGLAFSVKRSRSDNFPPSLRRIFEALQQDSDINFQKPYHGGKVSNLHDDKSFDKQLNPVKTISIITSS